MRSHAIEASVAAATLAAGVFVASQAGADGSAGRPLRLALSGAEEFDTAGNPINPHGDADRGSGGHSSRELADAGADVVLRSLEDFPAWLHRYRART